MKKRNLRLLAIIMATVVAVGTTPKTTFANDNREYDNSDIEKLFMERIKSKSKLANGGSWLEGFDLSNDEGEYQVEGNPEEVVRIIVELENKPATLMLPDGEQPTEDMIERVKQAQRPIQAKVEKETDAEIRHTYGNLINGFSAEVKRKEIDKIKAMDGVADVQEARIYYTTMNTAKEATEALDVVNDYGYSGEGLVVSVIDTGIDYTHKDMTITDPSKAKLDEDDANIGPGKFYSDKVPYGYNYADDNDQIIDTTGSMHGMHVAGIVAANGSDEEVNNKTGIQGVAPEAQVLAMRVFSDNANNPGAYSDDIIAAIEGSVEVGADIINMSLGSNSGYRDELEPEQIAIKNATDDGVICVVSAGNSATSLDPIVMEGISDISTVGAPGVAKDALQVASSDNSYMALPAIRALVNDSEILMGYTECDVDPTDVFADVDNLQLVYCGFGTVEEFQGKELTGKIALVSRGSIAFADKQMNAQAAGAAGVIIYNNADGYINMASDPSVKIPAVSISQAHGEMLKNSIASANIAFNGDITEVAIGDGLAMSDFTSWGPTPTLDFAPQITAPGGSIYSTLNNNKYGNKSGTSMAAPHAAGATALIMQGLKDNGIELEGRELVEFVKKTIINTSKTLTETNALGEENVPYSPRRQGSGLVQTKAAIDNRVLVTGEDGEATVALKEIGDTTEFTLTLTNYSNKDAEYSVENFGGVLTAFTPSMVGWEGAQVMAFDAVLEGASLDFDKDKVVVPANGQATVKVTLNVPTGSVDNNFVEGFVKFNAVDENTPSLVVPYMGFYGDWNAQKIVDGAIWEPEKVTVSPAFGATEVWGEYNYLGYIGRDENGQPIIDPNKIAFSPNDNYVAEEFVPVLYLLRNAEEIRMDVLDKDMNVIAKDVVGDSKFRKKILSNLGGDTATIYDSLGWDGKVYNNKTGMYEVVADGQYYLNYRAKIAGEGREFQDFVMPVKVDTEKVYPVIVSEKKAETTDYMLELEFGGDLENGGIDLLEIVVNGKNLWTESSEDPFKISGAVVDGDKLSVNLSEYLKEDELNYVQVAVSDYAYNINYESSIIEIGNCKATADIVGFPEGEYIASDYYIVYGEYSGPVGTILVNGEEVNRDYDGIFTKEVMLTEGRNIIKFYAEDMDGNVIANYSHKIYSDLTAPMLNVTSPYINENDVAVTTGNTLRLKGSVQDNLAGYKFVVNGELKLDIGLSGGEGEDTYREFDYEVPVENGDIVTLTATDLAGNETFKQFTVEVVEEIIPEVVVSGVEAGRVYNNDVTPVITVNPEGTKYVATLNNEAYNGEVISAEGNYELVVKAKGSLGNEYETKVSFVIDKTAPTINLTGVENGNLYNTNVTPNFESEAGANVTATLNGEAYEGTAVVEEGKYELKITSTDKAGNTSEVVVNFEIDKTAPTVTVEGVVDGMKYDKKVKPVITVEEGADYTVTLNGESYDGKDIKDDGEYTLKVVATDKAGNITEVSYAFKVENPKTTPVDPTPTPDPDKNPNPNPGGDKETDKNNGNNGNSGKPGKPSKLPNTGAPINPISFAGIGLAISGIGASLFKKRNKR